jgi:hypothetical protein
MMPSANNELPVYSWKTHGELSLVAYKQGYRTAINTLMLKVIDNKGTYIENLHNNCLVYPITFLCRHYIEIELKQVIALADMMHLADTKKKFGHKLKMLWADVLKCVESVQGEDRRKEFEETFEALIEFFERVDPYGDGFRYPKNIQGKAQWDNSFEIDISKMNSQIVSFEEYFDELLEELKQMLDAEARDMSDRIYFY